MKKLLSIVLLVIIVVLLALFYLTKKATQQSSTFEPTNSVVKSPPLETNMVGVDSNTTLTEPASYTTNIIESILPMTNALTATNLKQWTTAVKDLKKLSGFTVNQHWLMEQPGRIMGLPITLRVNDNAVEYSAVLISVNAENESGQIMRVEMQTPNMNIDETRELGLQLCNMFGRDPSDFLTWCDKIGNHWLDSPLYSSRNIYAPNSNETFGFQTLHTYNNDKPWIINFVITSP